MRSSEVKTICGRCGVFLGPNSSKTTFPPTFWATLRGWQLLTLKKKKMHGGGGKRIIFKKEHNPTFLSATHCTPPPHSLVSPPASLPFHSPSPASLPGCWGNHTFPHAFPALCPRLGGRFRHHTGDSGCVRTRGCRQAGRNRSSSSSRLQMCGNQNMPSVFGSPALTGEP